jgi:hypothetical protein
MCTRGIEPLLRRSTEVLRVRPSLADGRPNLNFSHCQRACTAPRHIPTLTRTPRVRSHSGRAVQNIGQLPADKLHGFTSYLSMSMGAPRTTHFARRLEDPRLPYVHACVLGRERAP